MGDGGIDVDESQAGGAGLAACVGSVGLEGEPEPIDGTEGGDGGTGRLAGRGEEADLDGAAGLGGAAKVLSPAIESRSISATTARMLVVLAGWLGMAAATTTEASAWPGIQRTWAFAGVPRVGPESMRTLTCVMAAAPTPGPERVSETRTGLVGSGVSGWGGPLSEERRTVRSGSARVMVMLSGPTAAGGVASTESERWIDEPVARDWSGRSMSAEPERKSLRTARVVGPDVWSDVDAAAESSSDLRRSIARRSQPGCRWARWLQRGARQRGGRWTAA